MTFSAFKTKWIGKRVDYDKVFGYQCVDLIKQYLKEREGLSPGAWGNAIDYWYKTNPAILKGYYKVATSRVKRSDIVIMKGLSGNPYGHIGLADAKYIPNYPYFKILEQNGSSGSGTGLGADAIRTKWKPRSRVIGVLRRKT